MRSAFSTSKTFCLHFELIFKCQLCWDQIFGDFISDNTFFDTILIAAGKTPNIQKLYLNGAGIEYSLEEGIYVDEYMRTSNFNVFAIGNFKLCKAKHMIKLGKISFYSKS